MHHSLTLILYRPKAAAGEELAKAQPFARSESTAAQVVKRRQAQAELEMVPCTFHPTLDPHSLALVAARVSHSRFMVPYGDHMMLYD